MEIKITSFSITRQDYTLRGILIVLCRKGRYHISQIVKINTQKYIDPKTFIRNIFLKYDGYNYFYSKWPLFVETCLITKLSISLIPTHIISHEILSSIFCIQCICNQCNLHCNLYSPFHIHSCLKKNIQHDKRHVW